MTVQEFYDFLAQQPQNALTRYNGILINRKSLVCVQKIVYLYCKNKTLKEHCGYPEELRLAMELLTQSVDVASIEIVSLDKTPTD